MCGIVGHVVGVPLDAVTLLRRLQRLEYRGYDSYGYATATGGRKDVGRVRIDPADACASGTWGFAHTRWATHGGVTHANAHPHTVGRVTLVHNGIIENYATLASGVFESETDSERLAAAIDAALASHAPVDALRAALSRAQGTWAVAARIDGADGIFLARKDAPLLLGALTQGFVFASDARAMPDAAEIAQIPDGAIVQVAAEVRIWDRTGATAPQWEPNAVERDEQRPAGHAMLHEINETPAALSRGAHDGSAVIGDAQVIGCGSSYNAALLASAMVGPDARVTLATEYVPRSGTLVAVSQSGETADILDAVKRAKAAGVRVIALVNTPHSTLTRLADHTLYLHAGEERCVAATKSFTLQVVALCALFGHDAFSPALQGARAAIDAHDALRTMASTLSHEEHLYVIGRGPYWAVAQELALKLKEIAYVHAEAFQALELKHGPLALVTQGTKVLVLGDTADARLQSTMHEVAARGGTVVALRMGEGTAAVFDAIVAGQLLTYEIAVLRGTEIDHPRNLAKSVTVY